jgi:hypothetical protein
MRITLTPWVARPALRTWSFCRAGYPWAVNGCPGCRQHRGPDGVWRPTGAHRPRCETLEADVADRREVLGEVESRVAAHAEEVERYRALYNKIRPHETLGFATPITVHLAEPNLFEAETVQES